MHNEERISFGGINQKKHTGLRPMGFFRVIESPEDGEGRGTEVQPEKRVPWNIIVEHCGE